ncbi:MAG TPA: saccharopine dehydrogenase NADP-binding domain-containing protein [Burkholderiaceae bacterium]|nr:saccharopine dehydrogenase NADP-binding domain-containing protein [Burkholderiaceae bacterium]
MGEAHPNHGRIDGAIVIIGFGSIGRGLLPLIERHFTYDPHRLHVIEPSDENATFLAQRGIHHLQTALTKDNYREVLTPLLGRGSFCVHLSVDTSSLDLLRLARELGALYIDTVAEPWAGFYFDLSRPPRERSNYALREALRAEARAHHDGPTAVSCSGANPGMVSWLLKDALLRLAADMGRSVATPTRREGWARLMQELGVKGVHIAERDTQAGVEAKPVGTFVNTWSVEGFVAEVFQPCELGWGTHERWFPPNAHRHPDGCRAAIYLDTPGVLTKVHTWTPAAGPQYGFLITHNEAISIADYYTVGSGDEPEYRPTCHYAYHPCDASVLSLHEMLGSGRMQSQARILEEHHILWGSDDLGVLLYGHAKNALWYGSRLAIDEARDLAPYQNATGLQVTSAVLAGMAWALANPRAGIVETDEMDHEFCLNVQRPYLGRIEAHYTNWTPISTRWPQFEEEIDESDPWQFKNVLAS